MLSYSYQTLERVMAMRQHIVILNRFLEELEGCSIASILDAGSGRSSLSTIVSHFPQAEISAVVYPGDRRKLDTILPIQEASKADLHVLERDLCRDAMPKSYDLVVAHLLLGEAATFGNQFAVMLERLLGMNFRYLIIIDYLEDPHVDRRQILQACERHCYAVLDRLCLENEAPQVWPDFTGKHNFGYLICAKSIS